MITFKTRNKNSTESVNLMYLSELNERRVIKVQRGFIDKRRAIVGQSNICSDGREIEVPIDFAVSSTQNTALFSTFRPSVRSSVTAVTSQLSSII